jgi:hypothetical protein
MEAAEIARARNLNAEIDAVCAADDVQEAALRREAGPLN